MTATRKPIPRTFKCKDCREQTMAMMIQVTKSYSADMPGNFDLIFHEIFLNLKIRLVGKKVCLFVNKREQPQSFDSSNSCSEKRSSCIEWIKFARPSEFEAFGKLIFYATLRQQRFVTKFGNQDARQRCWTSVGRHLDVDRTSAYRRRVFTDINSIISRSPHWQVILAAVFFFLSRRLAGWNICVGWSSLRKLEKETTDLKWRELHLLPFSSAYCNFFILRFKHSSTSRAPLQLFLTLRCMQPYEGSATLAYVGLANVRMGQFRMGWVRLGLVRLGYTIKTKPPFWGAIPVLGITLKPG